MAVEQAPPIAVRPFRDADEPAVVELLGLAFGGWPRGIEDVDSSEFFRWKTSRCPFGAPLSLVAEEHGQLVGFLAQLPWPLRVAARTLVSMRGMDLAVHPAHRRRGVSMAIIRAAMRSQPASIAITWNNPNELSRGGLLKTRPRELLSVRRFIRPGARPARTLARGLARGSRTPARLAIEAESAADALADGHFVTLLLERLPPPPDRLSTARTLDYLRWRYAELEHYRAVRIGADAGDGGIAIFRPRRRGSLWFLEICELLAARDATARKLLASVKRAAPADFLCCALHSRRQAARWGFVKQARAIELTVRPVHPDLPLDPAARSAWALSLGDLELL